MSMSSTTLFSRRSRSLGLFCLALAGLALAAGVNPGPVEADSPLGVFRAAVPGDAEGNNPEDILYELVELRRSPAYRQREAEGVAKEQALVRRLLAWVAQRQEAALRRAIEATASMPPPPVLPTEPLPTGEVPLGGEPPAPVKNATSPAAPDATLPDPAIPDPATPPPTDPPATPPVSLTTRAVDDRPPDALTAPGVGTHRAAPHRSAQCPTAPQPPTPVAPASFEAPVPPPQPAAPAPAAPRYLETLLMQLEHRLDRLAERVERLEKGAAAPESDDHD